MYGLRYDSCIGEVITERREDQVFEEEEMVAINVESL